MKSLLLLAALTVSAPSSPTEQNEMDSRWLPWLGCWELVDDERRDPLIGIADPTQGQDVPERGFVCLNPAPGANGVTVSTASGGETFLEETLIANGEKNPSAKGNCTGWQQTHWSNDGHRLFTRAELTCEEHRHMKVSGLSMMVPRQTWVDVQIVESQAGRAVITRRYRPAHEEDVTAAGITPLDAELALSAYRTRLPLTDPLSVEDIAEAASRVAPEAVEAAVLEYDEGFALDAEALVALSDAGVRPGLIDLMVALSYPDEFVVKTGTGDSTASGGIGLPGGLYGTGIPYSLSSPYYLTPFSYYYWYAPYHPRYVVRPVAIPEVRQGIVSRQGYTQVSPRPGQRGVRHRGSGAGAEYSAGGSTSGGSDGGSVSGQGYSRGGASGRTAVPKKR